MQRELIQNNSFNDFRLRQNKIDGNMSIIFCRATKNDYLCNLKGML